MNRKCTLCGYPGGGHHPDCAMDVLPPLEHKATRRAAILDTAKQRVTINRQAEHGVPKETFGMIAKLWSAQLGIEITPPMVCLLMASLKIARAHANDANADNFVDLAGYAACGGELAGAE